MNDTILIGIVAAGAIIWVWLGAIEAVYNRCKRRKMEALLTCSINALANLSQAHEGWEHGMGPCVCEHHRAARLVIRRYHEQGRK